MRQLLFKTWLLNEIKQGIKTSTFRPRCHLKIGEIVRCTNMNQSIYIQVIDIRIITLKDITNDILRTEHIQSKRDLIKILKRFYIKLPKILYYIQFRAL